MTRANLTAGRRAAHAHRGRMSALAGALGLAGALAVASMQPAIAAEGDQLSAVNRFSGATVGFDLTGSYRNVTLTVVGPNGFAVTAHSDRTAPVINLNKFGKVEDGMYKYSLTAATTKRVPVRSQLDNGRGDAEKNERFAGVSTSGSFLIKDGAIFQPKEMEER